ncbi:MAG TPA: hypothetical protein VGR90_09230, partial [Acidimicrobiales bacterium]|nr:hypothetical protein [Acidimicrobiales bacterium]
MTYAPATWAEQLLEDVNKEAPNETPVPIDANTVGDILHWMPAEEPTSDWYDRNNPLNASAGTSASDGTGSYPDLSTGAWYTAGMIDQGNMAGIRAALAANDPVSGFSPAVVASPWASSHYGGDPQHIAETGTGGGPAPASSGTPGSLPNVNLADLSSPTATDASLNANPFDLFGIPQTAASAVWSEVGPFLAKAMLVLAGLGL